MSWAALDIQQLLKNNPSLLLVGRRIILQCC
jgi:hypothetical protein